MPQMPQTDAAEEPPHKTITCFTNERRRTDRTVIEVRFSPATADDVCSIMQEPIPTIEPEFMPGNPALFQESPDINMATLTKCGHSFHAVSLVYHFMRNCMACPVCRHGSINSRMNARCFGNNRIVKRMQRKVDDDRRQEREQQIQEEALELAELAREADISLELTHDVLNLMPFCSIMLFPNAESLSTPNFTMQCPMRFVRATLCDGSDADGNIDDESYMLNYQTTPESVQNIAANISTQTQMSSAIMYITTR
jgi:hypothetical protein